jgi:hypothetical protein
VKLGAMGLTFTDVAARSDKVEQDRASDWAAALEGGTDRIKSLKPIEIETAAASHEEPAHRHLHPSRRLDQGHSMHSAQTLQNARSPETDSKQGAHHTMLDELCGKDMDTRRSSWTTTQLAEVLAESKAAAYLPIMIIGGAATRTRAVEGCWVFRGKEWSWAG